LVRLKLLEVLLSPDVILLAISCSPRLSSVQRWQQTPDVCDEKFCPNRHASRCRVREIVEISVIQGIGEVHRAHVASRHERREQLRELLLKRYESWSGLADRTGHRRIDEHDVDTG